MKEELSKSKSKIKRLWSLLIVLPFLVGGCALPAIPIAIGGITYIFPLWLILLVLTFKNPKIFKMLLFAGGAVILFTTGIITTVLTGGGIWILAILLFVLYLVNKKK